ncbi:MAG: glycosyltransferase [Bacteroidetes bacterium]|nr:glycosyltransferase [Bacteroidota bacterium]
MKKHLTIYIGYDSVESVAWHTLVHSIYSHASQPVSIVPLNLNNLKGIYTRERDPKQSNDFSFTRFLVPYLNNYDGMAIFMDCDMLLRTDIYKIFDEIDNLTEKAVYVVKHDYEAKEGLKYLNTVQYSYPRKNWSSFILWNCNHTSNRKVTSDYVNSASAMELHRFLWLEDSEIGELDVRWNWLVGDYSNPPSDVKNIHWTLGGPYFNEFKDVDFSEEWSNSFEKMKNCDQR